MLEKKPRIYGAFSFCGLGCGNGLGCEKGHDVDIFG